MRQQHGCYQQHSGGAYRIVNPMVEGGLTMGRVCRQYLKRRAVFSAAR